MQGKEGNVRANAPPPVTSQHDAANLTKTVSDAASDEADTASLSSHGQNASISSAPHKDSQHSTGGLSSFLGRDFHHNRHSSGSAIGQMLAPAISVAGAHNPFSINALCEDGSRKKTHQYGKSDKKSSSGPTTEEDISSASEVKSIASDGTDKKKHHRPRKRDRIRSAFGRSLSPWRYHNEQSEGGGERRRVGHWNLSRQSRDSLDVQREKSKQDGQAELDAESDAESIKSGIVPRNSAFANYSEDESESEDEMGSGSEVRSRIASGISGDSKGTNPPTRTTSETTTTELPAKDEVEAQVPHDTEDQDAAHQEQTNTDEDSDDYIDFDEETLDNTLYNAGCIDLHDAWLKDNHVHHTHEQSDAQAHYGPNDYDAAWQGAGPSGHDEGDEGLRAPNVVIGQNQSVSPSDLSGEGMEILSIGEGMSKMQISPRPSSARSTSSVSSVTTATTTSKTSARSAETPDQSTDSNKGSAEGSTPSTSPSQRLSASRPIFEKNRCTITLVHGEYEKMAKESKQTRRYIAASDGSEESAYAIEWTIGTVLRDGDEMLVVSVMETDTKLDAKDAKHEDKIARQEHQRIRQSMAVILARRAVAVLQRTRLAVRVSCQALHARNSRHMFIDMIDFFEPTMCVVGSRGLGSLKGVLLGSFSHYCVQKSPVPVMVARKRLKLPPLPKGKTDVVSNVRARHMRLDQALIEKDANVADEVPDADGEKGTKEGDEQDSRDNKKGGDGEEIAGAEDDDDDDRGIVDGTASVTAAAGDVDISAREDDTKRSSESHPDKVEHATRLEKEKEEESAIKRDAQQATELQEKEREAAAKKHKKHKDQVISDDVKTDADATSFPTRGRKKFSVGLDEEDGDDEEQRGRSRSRTSERT